MAVRARGFAGVGMLAAVIALLSFPARPLPAQQMLDDVVYLKDGTIVRGIIVEQRPGESVLIRTKDGNQFRFQMSQIDKMTREAPIGGAPAGAGAAAPAPTLAPASPPARTGRGPKSGGTAVLLSVLLTGGGQFYNGNAGLGIGLLLTGVAAAPFFADALFTCYDSGDECGTATALGILVFGSKIVSIAEAPGGSKKWNREHGWTSARFVPRPHVAVVPMRAAGKQRLGLTVLRATF